MQRSYLLARSTDGDLVIRVVRRIQIQVVHRLPRVVVIPPSEPDDDDVDIDPAWQQASGDPPPGALSTIFVRCAVCDDVHRKCDRKRWNGTWSYCPCCSSPVTTYVD